MTENENQDASSKNRCKNRDNDGPTPWSDLNPDVLVLVLMRLGVFDFHAFNGVCKSWRSVALSNKNKFMASRPPMTISIPDDPKEEDYSCCIEDNEGKTINSILPHSGGRACIGFTYGHLILFGKETQDFWLLDPVTKHGVHFPDKPSSSGARIMAFLVFSPSLSRLVFVMSDKSTNIWVSIAGKGTWSHVTSASPIVDIHDFKGNVYAVDESGHLYELSLNLDPELKLLETKNFPNFKKHQHFLSCCGTLYLVVYLPEDSYELHQLDFEEMKWVSRTYTAAKSSAAADHKCNVFLWKHMAYPMIV